MFPDVIRLLSHPGHIMFSLLRSLYVSPIPPQRDASHIDSASSVDTLEARMMLSGLAPDDFEDNDSFAAHYSLANVVSETFEDLTIDAAGDDDYYTFTALGDGHTLVGLSFSHASGDLNLRVYEGPGTTLIGSSTSTTDDELVTFTAEADVTYYIEVWGQNGACNTYDLVIGAPGPSPDSLETNDSLAEATSLPTVGPNANVNETHSLNIHNESDEDWFVFDVTANTADVTVEIDFVHDNGDLDLELHRVSGGGTTLIEASESTEDRESITQSLQAGQYAIRVYGFSGETNSYEFNFQATDGDGGGGNLLTDIIGRTDSGTWWVGESDGTSFTQRSFGRWGGPSWTDTQYADFNGDGLADVAARSSNGTWWVGLSDGTRFSTSAWSRWSTSAGWTNISTGDFNGDGMIDIVGRSASGTWWVGLSTGTGFQTSAFATWGGSGWNNAQYADFNGDGRTDIAARSSNGTWWVGLSTGTGLTTSAWSRWSTSAGWTNISIGDFDGDGQADVVGRSSSGTWWIGLSTGSGFQTGAFGRWAGEWQNIQYADLNNDGCTDVVARSANGTWWVGLSNGETITTSAWSRWNPSAGWHNIMTGDFNGDGTLDVAGRTSSGTWWVGISDGTRFVTSAFGHWSTGVTWADPGAANFV